MILLFAVVYMIAAAQGHGRLLEPPSRSSMHRYKQTDPMLIPYRDIIEANYNDNQLYCGGRQVSIVNLHKKLRSKKMAKMLTIAYAWCAGITRKRRVGFALATQL